MNCVNSAVGWSYLREEAVETNDYGVHPGVPYVLVNDEVLPDGESLLKAICDRLDKNVLPAGCKYNINANNGHKWSNLA